MAKRKRAPKKKVKIAMWKVYVPIPQERRRVLKFPYSMTPSEVEWALRSMGYINDKTYVMVTQRGQTLRFGTFSFPR